MATLVEAAPEVIGALEAKLKNPGSTLAQKYRALFSLRNVKGDAAHRALETALKDESALFRHDVAFCMGQRQDPLAVEVLTRLLHDPSEHPMVRHEAGEALGAIGREECLVPLRQHVADPVQEVRETCQLALQRIQYYQQQQEQQQQEQQPKQQQEQVTTGGSASGNCGSSGGGCGGGGEGESPYLSVDPTPALPASTPLEVLRATLVDESATMFERYRALFALRNRGGDEAAAALAGAFAVCSSALLKHEVAYVLGQMQLASTVQLLGAVLQDSGEAAMVRHEAAEALGSIGTDACSQLLRSYAADPEPIVAHSCEVALDMAEFEASGGFEYADVVGEAASTPAAAEAQVGGARGAAAGVVH